MKNKTKKTTKKNPFSVNKKVKEALEKIKKLGYKVRLMSSDSKED